MPEGDGAGAYVLDRDFVGDIDDLRIGCDVVNNTLHRSGETIEVTEVSSFTASSLLDLVYSWLELADTRPLRGEHG